MPDAVESCPLSEFSGRTAEILQLNLSPTEARRLRRLGVFEGQLIELQPHGNPAIVFSVAGGRVAIAREVAQQIVVLAKDDPMNSAGSDSLP